MVLTLLKFFLYSYDVEFIQESDILSFPSSLSVRKAPKIEEFHDKMEVLLAIAHHRASSVQMTSRQTN